MSLYLGENLISGNKPINLGVRNIGEVFPALLPVTDAGAHLLDGSLILGGGIYQGFVDYIANLYNANRTLATVVVRPIAISEGYELGSNSDDTYTAISNNSFNTGDSPHYIGYYASTSGESSSSSSSPDEHGIVIDDPIDIDPICLPTNTEITFNNLGIFDYTFGDVTITFQILFDQCTYTGAIPNYFCTESEWQTSVSTYGSCGKFVYDSVNNTVRLPKVSDILQGTTDITALGNLIQAGLPVPSHTHTRGSMNITGTVDSLRSGSGWWRTYTGCFYNTGVNGERDQTNGGSQQANIGFDASRNWTGSTSQPNGLPSIYGNSSTVQPQTIKVLYYIVIANSTKTEIQSDIDEIATDLNGKADVDLTNVTVPYVMSRTPNEQGGIVEIWSDGYCVQTGKLVINSASVASANYSTKDLTLPVPYTQLTSYYVQAKHDRFNAGFASDVIGKACSSVSVYQVNDSGNSFANPYVVWRTEGYIR